METVAKQEIRMIKTSQFGPIDVQPQNIFVFDEGLLGFDDLREFVIITDEQTVPFRWLISVEKPDIGFPLLSPWHVDLSYKPGKKFDLETEVLLVVITLNNDDGVMTANMKAPIILNVNNQSGRQIILPSDRYSTDYAITKK